MKFGRKRVITTGILALVASIAFAFQFDFAPMQLRFSEKSDPGNTVLSAHRDKIRLWSLNCMGVAAKENCDVGDAVLFNGILCLSGELFACEAVKNSQGASGRVWRAPSRVDYETTDTFSRDMALGALAYLVATKDKDFAQKWLHWIQTHKGRLCLLASDNRCNFTPGLWDFFGDVWNHIGLAPSAEMLNDFFDDSLVQVMQARATPLGFSMHLVGVNLLIRKSFLRASEDSREDKAADILVERQPVNPFFMYLRDGSTPEVRALAFELCPIQAPSNRNQWFVERDTAEQAWNESMGWDCIALLNLILKK